MPEGTTAPPPGGTGAPAVQTFKEIIPAEFHERGWAKPYLDKPFNAELGIELTKKLDGAETLIGKKTLIPGPDAKPEEIDAFLGKLRPEKADDYEIKAGEKADQEFLKTFREAAHHAGMNKVQLARQLEKLSPFFAAREKAAADAIAAREAEFATLVKAAVGPEHEKKTARVQNALKELAPDSVKQFIDKIDDKNLVLVVAAVDAILTKYAGEDDFNPEKNPGGGGGADKAALVEESKKIFASEAWTNFQHPEHDKAKKRIEEIYASPLFKA
jgi:hypothetical protein